MIRSWNGKVGVEPFPDMSIKIGKKGEGTVKVGFIEQKSSLVKLKVLFGPRNFGTELRAVWVPADLYVQPWAKKIFELNPLEPFIMLPENLIELAEYDERHGYSYPFTASFNTPYEG